MFNDLAADVTSVDIEGQQLQAQGEGAAGEAGTATAEARAGGDETSAVAAAPKVSLADFELMTVSNEHTERMYRNGSWEGKYR